MIVFPAIDIHGGKVVRLRQGDPNRKIVYADDPVEVARRWADEGAGWIHVVNLDGSFSDAAFNLKILEQMAQFGPQIQFGGGLREVGEIRQALDAGASRVVLGTLVVRLPYIAEEAVAAVGTDSIIVALDARRGEVAIHGWQQQSGWSPVELGQRFAKMGVTYALYTDITRDGELRGVNVEGTAQLARETGLEVVASGGVASLDDVRALKQASAKLEKGCICGVVIGRALYSGAVDLAEALQVAAEEPRSSFAAG